MVSLITFVNLYYKTLRIQPYKRHNKDIFSNMDPYTERCGQLIYAENLILACLIHEINYNKELASWKTALWVENYENKNKISPVHYLYTPFLRGLLSLLLPCHSFLYYDI